MFYKTDTMWYMKMSTFHLCPFSVQLEVFHVDSTTTNLRVRVRKIKTGVKISESSIYRYKGYVNRNRHVESVTFKCTSWGYYTSSTRLAASGDERLQWSRTTSNNNTISYISYDMCLYRARVIYYIRPHWTRTISSTHDRIIIVIIVVVVTRTDTALHPSGLSGTHVTYRGRARRSRTHKSTAVN
jgi:hypothetical protein